MTLREAAVTVLVAAVASDGTLAPVEDARLSALLSSMRLYSEVPPEHLQYLIDNAVEMEREPEQDGIVLYDLTRRTRTPLSFPGNANSRYPLWSPDGARLAFASQAAGDWDIYVTGPGGGTMEPLVVGPGDQLPMAWSPSDGALAYLQRIANQFDLWIKPRDGKPAPLIVTPFRESTAVFSPDGRWLAYVSEESGRSDVYVQRYPGPGEKLRISPNGGSEPQWNPRGGELFFRQADGTLMRVAVQSQAPAANGQPGVVTFGKPLDVPAPAIYAEGVYPNYDVSRDGRLLIIESLQSTLRPVVVVLNWHEELKRLVPPR